MGRRVVAYLLMFALISANFSRLFIYAGFELNRNYIAAKLCENKNKPWLHCNGKCYFMKKIRQAEEKEKNDGRQSQKSLFQDAFHPIASDIKFHSFLLQVLRGPHDNGSLPRISSSIFRPPQLA
jgi:hypothetical protein